MNKKLISKCCHSEVSESVYFTCLGCGQICEVIEIEEPQPIQKEEVKTATEMMVNDMQEEEYYRIKHTSSDTFIEGIIKKFREQFVASDNRFLTGTETVGKAEKFIRQSFKSSLQEQKQSILEEIEKKILELIAYSSFDVSNCGYVSERNCTVEEAMSQLSKDVERLLKDNKE